MEALLALANIPLAQIETEAARLLGSGIAIGLGLIGPGIGLGLLGEQHVAEAVVLGGGDKNGKVQRPSLGKGSEAGRCVTECWKCHRT